MKARTCHRSSGHLTSPTPTCTFPPGTKPPCPNRCSSCSTVRSLLSKPGPLRGALSRACQPTMKPGCGGLTGQLWDATRALTTATKPSLSLQQHRLWKRLVQARQPPGGMESVPGTRLASRLFASRPLRTLKMSNGNLARSFPTRYMAISRSKPREAIRDRTDSERLSAGGLPPATGR